MKNAFNKKMPLEIKTTSTWYKYPENKPSDHTHDDVPFEEYEVCWRWDSEGTGSPLGTEDEEHGEDNYFLSYVLWMDERWQEHDGAYYFYDFENPQIDKNSNAKRIVMYFRKTENPIKERN